MDKEFKEIVGQAEKYLGQGEFVKALDLYDLLLARDPANVHVRYCLGSLYSEMYKMGIAICLLEGVVKEEPGHPQAWNNLGIAYKNAAQWDKALECYNKALELNYDAMTIVNISGLYVNNGTPEIALKWSEKGLKLAPSVVQLHNHKSLALLEMGQWTEGFKEYEWRYGLPGYHKRDYGCPKWEGQKVGTLVIHGEQGLGDEILFMQALERVRPLADRIFIECATRLVEVFEHSFKLPCFGTEDELKKHLSENNIKPDAWVAMGSLFGLLGFDCTGKYLDTPKTYPKGDRFRIGISWRGGTVQTHQHLRNFDFRLWKPFAELDADVISLQYGPAGGMAQQLGIKHDDKAIEDIPTLMAMIKSCDLVVTVCNTAVHMAGSLGVDTLCLVPFEAAWRYGLTGDRSSFYSSVRYLRQQKGEDWKLIVDKVIQRLENYGVKKRLEAA